MWKQMSASFVRALQDQLEILGNKDAEVLEKLQQKPEMLSLCRLEWQRAATHRVGWRVFQLLTLSLVGDARGYFMRMQNLRPDLHEDPSPAC